MNARDFALEPIVAKTVLPILGGTPMVWNACVLFFQVLLLAGSEACLPWTDDFSGILSVLNLNAR